VLLSGRVNDAGADNASAKDEIGALRSPAREKSMTVKHQTKIAIFAGAILAAIGLPIAGVGCAYADDIVRVRGTIESVDGSTYTVKTRDGAEQKITLAPNAQVAGLVKASLADIKSGSFVGVTALPQPDGTQRALEVHIFPESMRGTGEGHYPWDLQPNSSMTNGNITDAVTAVDGQTVTVKYKDGEQKILVPATTPIVSYIAGDKNDLKVGAKVFIVAAKQPDGTLQGRAWRVGRDGATPPM
jgi:hypothetical protein